jgi:hypothetical protein
MGHAARVGKRQKKKYRALLGRPEERRLLDKPYAQLGFNTIKTDIKGI